jgi:hypothetical protein
MCYRFSRSKTNPRSRRSRAGTLSFTRRTKSISTKVTEAEYNEIARRAEPQTISAWARRARSMLSGAAQPDPLQFLLLAELLALRTIVLNLNFALAASGPLTTEAMHALIARADAEKLRKADDRIARLRPAVESTRQQAKDSR